MIPVMIGGLVLGGRSYKMRDYLQVLLIVGGTAVFNLAKVQFHVLQPIVNLERMCCDIS